MVIEEQKLMSLGADVEDYETGDIIFKEGCKAMYYFQIVQGEVKLNNYSEDGKETIQDILEAGQGIGESMLFMNKPYPVNAIAMTPCQVLKLCKSELMSLLDRHPENYIDMIRSVSSSMYFKFVMGQAICMQSPAAKLQALMDYLKSFQPDLGRFDFQIPLTRQQMASLTGLCVETTIRTLKNMERANIVRIVNRKILY